MDIKEILEYIAESCPSSKDIYFGTNEGVGMIFAEHNDTWGWYSCYSKSIEKMLLSRGLKWVYAFECVVDDYPYITMFIGEGDIKTKTERIIESVMSVEKVTLEVSHFMDICESYNNAFKDALSQAIFGIADTVININEV